MKNDPLIVITRDAIHESLSLQTEEERTRHSSPKLKRRSCVINHESNPKVRQYLLLEMTLLNFPTSDLDHEVYFVSFTWGVHSDCESPFREESLTPCLWRGVRAFVCLWDNWAPASDVGLGRLFVSGIQSNPWLQLGSVTCSNVFWQFLIFSDKDQKLKSHWINQLGYYQGGTEPESWKHTHRVRWGQKSQPSQG